MDLLFGLRLNLAKAASVFEMGPIQQTGLSGEGRREGGPLSIQAARCAPAATLSECVSVFCRGKTLGAGAELHIYTRSNPLVYLPDSHHVSGSVFPSAV